MEEADVSKATRRVTVVEDETEDEEDENPSSSLSHAAKALMVKQKTRPRRYRESAQEQEIGYSASTCTVIPSQVGVSSIALDVSIDIKNGFDIDENKEDAIIYGLEILIKKQWKTISQKSSDEPTIIFRIDGLQNRKVYKIRMKYIYYQKYMKFEKYSNELNIELDKKWISLIFHRKCHGKHIQFINDDRIICKGGDSSIVMDPMIISRNTFKKLVFALTVHKFGSKTCFGFIDYDKYNAIMGNNWDKCYLHSSRNGASKDGIYGLSTKLKSSSIYCCVNGQFIPSIKLQQNRQIMPDDCFIFEIVYDEEENKNYCNVYLQEISKKTKLLSGSNKYTFENIPSSIVPIFSHENYGESEVSIKVLIATFAS